MEWNEFKNVTSRPGYLEKFIKVFLLVVNIAFEIIGCVLVGIGIRFIFTLQRSGVYGLSLPIIFIVSGIIIVIISSLGYTGIKKEVLGQLRGYAWLLVVVFVTNVISIIVAASLGGQAFGVPEVSAYKEVFDRFDWDTDATAVVHKIQKSLYCCGYDGPESVVLKNETYPTSCCPNLDVDCKIPFIYQCKAEIARVIYPMSIIAKVVFYTLPVIEFFCIIGAFHLISILQKKLSVARQISQEYSNL